MLSVFRRFWKKAPDMDSVRISDWDNESWTASLCVFLGSYSQLHSTKNTHTRTGHWGHAWGLRLTRLCLISTYNSVLMSSFTWSTDWARDELRLGPLILTPHCHNVSVISVNPSAGSDRKPPKRCVSLLPVVICFHGYSFVHWLTPPIPCFLPSVIPHFIALIISCFVSSRRC